MYIGCWTLSLIDFEQNEILSRDQKLCVRYGAKDSFGVREK